jgi:hypothetical protein
MKTKQRTDQSGARAARLTAGSKRNDRPPAGNAVLITAELAIARCRWCNDDLEHCHDALVVHSIGEVHCMGVRCSTPPELHHMVADCSDFGCTCAEISRGRADSAHTA